MAFRVNLLAVAAIGLLGGCCTHPDMAKASTPIPLKKALDYVEADLRASAPMTLGDVASGDGGVLKAMIFRAQCLANEKNPVIEVVSGPLSLALQGSIQLGATGGFTISAAPSATASATVTRGQQQQLTLPVTFVSATGLANFYLGQMMANMSNLSLATDAAPKAQVARILKAILDTHDAIDTAATTQVTAFKQDNGGSAECLAAIKAPLRTVFPAIMQQ